MEAQFSRALFETKADAIILSIQPDITTNLLKHRREGFLFYPSDAGQWSTDDRQWLKTDFEPFAPLDVPTSMANLGAILDKIREQSVAPILIYNMSPIIPGEAIHCHQGMGEIFSTRMRKFNLGPDRVVGKDGRIHRRC